MPAGGRLRRTERRRRGRPPERRGRAPRREGSTEARQQASRRRGAAVDGTARRMSASRAPVADLRSARSRRRGRLSGAGAGRAPSPRGRAAGWTLAPIRSRAVPIASIAHEQPLGRRAPAATCCTTWRRVLVDQGRAGAGAQDERVAVDREQVDERPVDDVAGEAGGPGLLLLLERGRPASGCAAAGCGADGSAPRTSMRRAFSAASRSAEDAGDSSVGDRRSGRLAAPMASPTLRSWWRG